MRFCYHGIPASVCAGPCVPSSPPLPGALCFGGVLLPPSLLIRPHAPVSCPPANFPLTVISPASRARDLPYFASQTLRPCRRPPTPESSPGTSARLFSPPKILRREDTGSALSISRKLPSRGETSRRCSDPIMLRPGRLLAPLGSPVLRRRGLYPRSFHRGGHPIPVSDSLRGCQAFTAAGPSPAGLRWL